MRDDADAHAHVRQTPEHLRRAGHGLQDAEQIALEHGELMQLGVAAGRLRDAPLGQVPRDLGAERRLGHAQPLGGNGPQAGVEVRARAVEIDAEHEGAAMRVS